MTDQTSAAAPDDTERAAYTVNEFISRVVPMARASFYQEVRAGRIRIVKRGHRTYVPVDQGRAFIALLAAAMPQRAA